MTKAVYIGRFQPFHNGHKHVIDKALEDPRIEELTVIVGSTNKAITCKNPWTYNQRKNMIEACTDNKKVIVKPSRDFMYPELEKEELWNEHIRSLLPEGCKYIVGYEKDNSSYYLKNFPELEYVGVEGYKQEGKTLNATDIRSAVFQPNPPTLETSLPRGSLGWIGLNQNIYTRLRDEYAALEKEEEQFANYPYPTSLNSCVSDSVVYKDGKILVTKRGGVIGNGLIALAGGHKDSDETHLQAALKELVEETCISVSEETLKSCLVTNKLFDHPNRNLGVTKPSQVFLFDLTSVGENITVMADDDAQEVMWLDVEELPELENHFHDDHYDIIQEMLKEL